MMALNCLRKGIAGSKLTKSEAGRGVSKPALMILSGVILSLLCGTLSAAAPSNEELYRMLLEFKASQESLKAEAEEARAEAAAAKDELRRTEQALEASRKSLQQAEAEPNSTARRTPYIRGNDMETRALTLRPSRTLRTMKPRRADREPANRLLLDAQPEVADSRPVPDSRVSKPSESQIELGSAPSRSVVKIPNNKGGFFIEGEFLYLQPTTERLDYAIVDPEDTPAPLNIEPDAGSTLESIEPDFEPGFRVAAGYEFPGTRLDVGLRFAYLDAKTSESINEPPGGEIVVPISVSRTGREDADRAEAEYELDYRVLDLEVGQKFEVGDRIDLRLHGGVRYAKLDQEFTGRYFGDNFQAAFPGEVKMKTDYWGIGPRIGADGDWQIGAGFGIFGGLATSLLVGEFENEFSQNRTRAAPDVSGKPRGVKEKTDAQIVPVIEANAGLRWAKDFGDNELWVKAGYEIQEWFDATNFMQLPSGTAGNGGVDSQVINDRKNLGLHGPFFRVGGKF